MTEDARDRAIVTGWIVLKLVGFAVGAYVLYL